MQIYDVSAPCRSAPPGAIDRRYSGVKHCVSGQLEVLSGAAFNQEGRGSLRVTTFDRVMHMSHSVAIILSHSVGRQTLVEALNFAAVQSPFFLPDSISPLAELSSA